MTIALDHLDLQARKGGRPSSRQKMSGNAALNLPSIAIVAALVIKKSECPFPFNAFDEEEDMVGSP